MQHTETFLSRVTFTSTITGGWLLLLRIRNEEWLPAPGELLGAPPEEAIYGFVWLVSAAVTVWLAGTAVLSVVAYAVRIPAAIRAVEWITVRAVRRLARRTVALTLAMGSLSTSLPAGAAQLPPLPVVVTSEQAGGSDEGLGRIPPCRCWLISGQSGDPGSGLPVCPKRTR